MPYNTISNKTRIIKTPGGELRYLHIKKKGTAPKCGDCGSKLAGVSPSSLYQHRSPYHRSVSQQHASHQLSTGRQRTNRKPRYRSLPFVLANTPPSPARRRPSSAPTVAVAAPTASRTASCVHS